jgi:hypothetical protein
MNTKPTTVDDAKRCAELIQRLAAGEPAKALIVEAYRIGIEDFRADILARIDTEIPGDTETPGIYEVPPPFGARIPVQVQNAITYLIIIVALIALYFKYFT